MPKLDNTPSSLKPYVWHGVELDIKDKDDVTGDCPFCGKEGKFSVNVKTGQWRCFSCNDGADNKKVNRGGNVFTFLRRLHEESCRATRGADLKKLSEERGLLSAGTLLAWGVCRSVVDDTWLIPGYGADGKLNNLYRYAEMGGRMRVVATPELNHQLWGVPLLRSGTETVYVCEGAWDGMALWEVMSSLKMDGAELVPTSNIESSLLAKTAILAVPSCNTMLQSWLSLLAGKRVVWMYDNDHPRKHPKTGNVIPPAGYDGMHRASGMASLAEQPPAQLMYLAWGGEDRDHDPDLPAGCDVRDILTAGDDLRERGELLADLLDKVLPIPADWIEGRSAEAKAEGSPTLECIPCTEWQEVEAAFEKAMKWTDGLSRALTVMLSSILSVKSVGDQLWVKIVGPPACGKSTLCEAISISPHCYAKSTLRGFHSGYKTDKEGKEDNSLISSIRDKTLVTKDGDTLLQSPNLGQILSEARDVYDRVSRTHYRNKMGKDYKGVNMTWILCGTDSLRALDTSELGERFIDCVIMEKIDEALEDEILWMVVNKASRNMSLESNGKAETHQDPDMTRAMQLTGGYIDYLRSNANQLLSGITIDDEVMKRLIALGKFVAYMRARPSTKQDESAGRELASRLVSQFTRLAKCLAVVLNRESVDEEVMRRTALCARDTARGNTLNIVALIHKASQGKGYGGDDRTLSLSTGLSGEKTRNFLRFLKRIGALDVRESKKPGIVSKPRWFLTPKMEALYVEVMIKTLGRKEAPKVRPKFSPKPSGRVAAEEVEE